jgi:hypothetical protein
MSVGRSDRIDALVAGVTHHIEKLRIDKRLSLEIKNEIEQIFVKIIHGIPEKICFQVARVPGECPEATGAFRAAQVAGSGRFK